MFKKTDPYSFRKYYNLFSGNTQIGCLIADYKVSKYDDVQALDAKSISDTDKHRYLIDCSQRVIITNTNDTLNLKPSTELSYKNYPVLLNTFMELTSDSAEDYTINLAEYAPHTINTAVQSSGSKGDSSGKTSGSSSSSTVGSSTAQTNSYGASVSVGLTPMSDSASVHAEHSSTTSHSHSSTTGSSSSISHGHNDSQSSSMSLKDWGTYAFANPKNASANWVFGQEYPWDAVNFRKIDDSTSPPAPAGQVRLIIPSDVEARLYDQVSLQPPSQLSRFGINFIMKCVWEVEASSGKPAPLKIAHRIFLYNGSHFTFSSGETKSVAIFMDESPSMINDSSGGFSVELNPAIMALDVLGSQRKPAIVGFVPNKFYQKPTLKTTTVAVPFSTLSTSNTLLVEDTTQYDSLSSNDIGFLSLPTALRAKLPGVAGQFLSYTIYFKVVDTISDYTLHLKHWKTGTADIKLTFIINNDSDNSLVKYVDALEAEGGEANLLSIALRDQSYASVDYHDYLKLGLNSVEVQIESDSVGSDYAIRAISIE
jgi:hypothetical protein